MPTAPLETRVFIVNTGAMPTLNANRIEAAYYRTEGDFTTFKDVDNQPVYTVRNDQLMSVERAHGAEPVMASFVEALRRAGGQGSATVGFRNGTTDEASGKSVETGYDITVTRVDGALPATADVAVAVSGKVASESDLSKAVRKGMMRRGPGQSGI